LCKGCGIQELVHVVRSGCRTFPWNKQGIAARARGRVCAAGNRDRLPALHGSTPNQAPTADQPVCYSAGIGQKVPALAQRALVSATEMEDIPKIETRQTIVTAKSKAWHVVTTVSSRKSAPVAKRVLGITARFRPRVGSEKIQARIPLLDFDLK